MMMDVQHINETMDKFKTYILVELGLSPTTLMAYDKDIRDFLIFSEGISVGSIDGYTRLLKLRGLKDSTIGRKRMAIRCYCNHLVSEGLLDNSVPQMIDKPKKTKEPPRAILSESISHMLATIRKNSSKLRSNNVRRDVAIVLMLFDSGLRASELCSLNVGDVNVARKEIRVMGKGSIERVVPTTERTIMAFVEYRNPIACNSNDAVFLDSNNNRMTRRAIYEVIVAHSRKAGLSNITPHTLRKGCATHLMNGGVDVELIQQLMGHRSLSTTRDYLATDYKRLSSIHEKCHPFRRIHVS